MCPRACVRPAGMDLVAAFCKFSVLCSAVFCAVFTCRQPSLLFLKIESVSQLSTFSLASASLVGSVGTSDIARIFPHHVISMAVSNGKG